MTEPEGTQQKLSPLLNERGFVVPISLVTDEPAVETAEIGLGMQQWAEILAAVATGTEGPFTIGLFAPWGQGKTSVLRRACFVSGFADNVHTFIVNAWEHERHDDPLQPILEDVLRAIDVRLATEPNASTNQRLTGLKRMLSVVRLGAKAFEFGAPLLGLWTPGLGQVVGKATEAVAKAAEAAKEAQDAAEGLFTKPGAGAPGSGTGLRAYLEQAKKQYLPEDKVIVFVDDLDRCHPDKAVLLLESIKHLLWVPGFVFVLALDNVILERYLQHRYEEDYGLKHDPAIGKRYLEKLVQLTIFLPESDQRFGEYVGGLLALPDGGKRLPDSTKPILVAGARNNPRYLKRRINDLIVDRLAYRALWDQVATGDDDAIVACLAVHRLLRDVLSPRELRALQSDSRLRSDVLAALEGKRRAGGEERSGSPMGDMDERRHESERAIVASLRDHGLYDLFATGGAGRVWFENDELCESTRTFLAASRPVDVAVPADQEALVNGAIRRALALAAEAPVTDDLRSKVASLRLEDTPLDDAGLLGVARLTALQTLDLRGTQVSDVSPLSGLTALQELDLQATQVSDVSPLSRLTALRALYLGGTQVSDVSPLSGLTALQTLDLWGTQVSDVSLLSRLTALQTLGLGGTQVSDVSLLSRLTALQWLDLDGTQVSDVSPLSGLTALQELDLQATQVSDVSPLSGLTALQTLWLTGTQVSDASPLAGLTALRELLLGNTQVSDVSSLAGLTALRALYLGGTQVSDVSPLSGLTALQTLDLWGTQVSDVSPLSGLTALQALVLDRTQVSDVSPLSGLTALQTLTLNGTQVSNLSPLSGLTALQTLTLNGTQVSDVSPLSRLTALQWLDLEGTQVSDVSPLAGHPSLIQVRLPDGTGWNPQERPLPARYGGPPD